MICRLCAGSGSHFVCQFGEYEWWKCQACAGMGVRAVFGPRKLRRATQARHGEE